MTLTASLYGDNMDGKVSLDTSTQPVPSDGIVSVSVDIPAASRDYWSIRMEPQVGAH